MTADYAEQVVNSVDSVHQTTEKIRNRFENVLAPSLEKTRNSAYLSKELVEILSKRITILFGLSILLNVATLFAVILTN